MLDNQPGFCYTDDKEYDYQKRTVTDYGTQYKKKTE